MSARGASIASQSWCCSTKRRAALAHVPLEGRLKIHAALEAAGTFFQWHEFNAAHAFIRDEGPRYNPVLAQQCYGLAIEMYKRRLGEGDAFASKAADAAQTKH